jgi:hypothetical protein
MIFLLCKSAWRCVVRNQICKTVLVCFAIGLYASSCGHVNAQVGEDQPVVVLAIVPNYSPLALSTQSSGEVLIEVRIDSKGSVTDARGISGKPILIGVSKYVARRWKFALSDNAGVRTARLTFVYRLVPKGTPLEDLLPVFKPPYRVEIAHVIPDPVSP